MSRWTEYRAGKHRRASHAARWEAPSSPARPVTIDKTEPLEKQAHQIRLLLQDLGLGYSCLCLYLSSRIDLLPAEFCREFALTPDTSPPLSAPETQRILEQEIGGRFPGAFLDFNHAPLQTTLRTQAHSATLASGIPVIVVILRPEYHSLQTSSDPPASFNLDLIRQLFGPALTEDVLEDFFNTLKRKCNFPKQAEVLQQTSDRSLTSELVTAPRIYRELSSSRILTLEPITGLSLQERVQAGSSNTDLLARRLCHAWLQEVLCGNGFPVDPQPHNVVLTQDNRIVFSGCDFTVLPAAARENLWNYLMATMVDDPDRATQYLLREMLPLPNANVSGESFRSKFRQAAYFGVLAPVLGTNSNTLPQLIFQHWKTALDHGQRPKPDLLCFYRGLFSIARIAYQLSPLGDPMREGVEEVRASRTMDRLREIVDWRYWFQNSDKFATAFIGFPRMLDEALTQASAPRQFNPAMEQPNPGQPRSRGTLSSLTVVLLLAGVLLAARAGANPLTDKLPLLLLLLGGLIALRESAD